MVVKACPDCGIVLSQDEIEKLYYCIDPDCGYVEYEEDAVPEIEEDNEIQFICPYCKHTLTEDDLIEGVQ
jgi:aspartate carbamoyltransferase regulatory subunit